MVLIWVPLLAPSYTHPPAHYDRLNARCRGGRAARAGCANPLHEQVFISVSLYDKGGYLAGGQWGEALLELVRLIGPDNVFLSIYENDSGPQGEAALKQFKSRVPCRHSIVNDAHVDMSIFPNVTMPDGTQRIKRLAYLSSMRNRALRPLDTIHPENGITPFDKILFLNDIAFRPLDAAHLLFSTNLGPHGRTRYLSTCALDYRNPFLFYDLYAQRDAQGFSNGLPFYPIFSRAGQAFSRADMLRQTDAVRVKSCWGGMVAMRARHVQNLAPHLPRPDFQAVGAHAIDPDRPRNVTAPVRFRHEPGLFFDACECCLFQADVARVAQTSGAPEEETGQYVNPYVRVAYDWRTLRWEPLARRFERLFALPHAVLGALAGLPTHNPHRTLGQGERFREEVWDGDKRRWEMVERTGRNGMFCWVREMQLVRMGKREGDKNWENTVVPSGQTLDFPS